MLPPRPPLRQRFALAQGPLQSPRLAQPAPSLRVPAHVQAKLKARLAEEEEGGGGSALVTLGGGSDSGSGDEGTSSGSDGDGGYSSGGANGGGGAGSALLNSDEEEGDDLVMAPPAAAGAEAAHLDMAPRRPPGGVKVSRLSVRDQEAMALELLAKRR